jgi:site-specific DNA-methyltransferase (cytosine-N4-specific)
MSTSNKVSVPLGLESIDWDFPNSSGADSLHNGHPYPAKFIPEIPRNLIDILGVPKNSLVFDPFCGSGTTLIEAQRTGHRSCGVDLNPIACLISKVKTTPLPGGLIETAEHCVSRAKKRKNPTIPPIPALDHWFEPEMQNAISALVEQILSVEEPALRDALRLCLSSIIVRVSNQESDTRYAAISKRINRDSAYQLFANSVDKLYRSLPLPIQTLPGCSVINSDILAVSPEDIEAPVGLAVTSPPYPNAYEYWLYHKYRMWWLGFDPLLVKDKEIGARAHFFKKNPPTKDDFAGQMRKVLTLIASRLVNGGHICIVIGRSKVHGEIIDNASIVISEATKLGLSLGFNKERILAASRKSFNLSHASIKSENLIVLRKE